MKNASRQFFKDLGKLVVNTKETETTNTKEQLQT